MIDATFEDPLKTNMWRHLAFEKLGRGVKMTTQWMMDDFWGPSGYEIVFLQHFFFVFFSFECLRRQGWGFTKFAKWQTCNHESSWSLWAFPWDTIYVSFKSPPLPHISPKLCGFVSSSLEGWEKHRFWYVSIWRKIQNQRQSEEAQFDTRVDSKFDKVDGLICLMRRWNPCFLPLQKKRQEWQLMRT